MFPLYMMYDIKDNKNLKVHRPLNFKLLNKIRYFLLIHTNDKHRHTHTHALHLHTISLLTYDLMRQQSLPYMLTHEGQMFNLTIYVCEPSTLFSLTNRARSNMLSFHSLPLLACTNMASIRNPFLHTRKPLSFTHLKQVFIFSL